MLIRMTLQDESGTPRELELAALRALCQGSTDGSLLREGLGILAGHRFVEPLHQVFFEVLETISSDNPAVIRDLLPARLNNRGFPDFDLEIYFRPNSLTRAQALELFRHLAAEKQ